MKIGIDARLLENMRGGPARYVINMLKLWPEISKKHEYVLYFKDHIPQDDFLQRSEFTSKKVNCPSLPYSFIPWEHIFLPAAVKKDRLDLFFSPWYMLPYRFQCPKKVVAAWDISYTTHPSHYRWHVQKYWHFFSKNACQQSNGIITCSYFDGSQIEKFYDIDASKICVVHLATEDKFIPLSDSTPIHSFKKKNNLPQSYLLSFGTIYNRRCMDVIINAFKQIHQEFPEIGLVIIGRNHTSPKIDIKKMIEPLKQKGQCVYMERCPEEDLVAMYNGASWYVCVSDCDGETIQIKEAMKCGTAVITSPLLQEISGDNALIIQDPTNVSQTSAAFRKAFSSPDLREDLAQKGRLWVEQYRWPTIAQKSLEFIESIK